MAQVLSGSSNVSYTNNTGQNVRIVINFMSAPSVPGAATGLGQISMSWAGVSIIGDSLSTIGRNLAFITASSGPAAVNAYARGAGLGSLPTEVMLAPGQTFSASCGPYNIVVIAEAG